jgi:hypothetical protein
MQVSTCHLTTFSTLKMEEIYSSETSVYPQRTTRRYIPEDVTLNYKNLLRFTLSLTKMLSSSVSQIKSSLPSSHWMPPTSPVWFMLIDFFAGFQTSFLHITASYFDEFFILISIYFSLTHYLHELSPNGLATASDMCSSNDRI